MKLRECRYENKRVIVLSGLVAENRIVMRKNLNVCTFHCSGDLRPPFVDRRSTLQFMRHGVDELPGQGRVLVPEVREAKVRDTGPANVTRLRRAAACSARYTHLAHT